MSEFKNKNTISKNIDGKQDATETYFETLYGPLWRMSIEEIDDLGLKNCLIILQNYLVDMLE